MKTILIVDDDVYISDMLRERLEKDSYQVLTAFSGTEALLVLQNRRPDLILLDLMLPGLSGEEVLPQLRDIPTIVLSAKADVGGKVRLLLDGAADYLTKPFDLEELMARITVQLRRTGTAADGVLSFRDIVLDPVRRSLTAAGEPVHLTRTEFAILRRLMENPRQVVTKSQLLDRLAEDTPDCSEATLKVHVSNLRGKLRERTGRDDIEAVWGIGFKLREA